MSWKKYFRVANVAGAVSPINGSQAQNMTYRNYQSNLPEVYIGHPNRIERYNQYEQMDMDSEVNAALDILAEFSTQSNEENGTAFKFYWKEQPTDNEVKIIREQLTQWVSLNELNKRIFKMFRNTIKYGDQVFIRDPETFKLFWVEVSKVVKVIVNEAEGKKPEQYILKDIAPNFENLTATTINTSDVNVNHPQVGGGSGAYIQPKNPIGGGSRFSHAQNEAAVNSEHIVHLTLTEGLDFSWPFGNSVLENVFKVFKQNRIPTQTGGGQNMMDATYNPLSTNEDYFFPQTAEGRGSKVDTLPGGSNLGEITDLHLFTNKLFRGLRIPSSYLPTGLDDGTSNPNSFSDGRVGTALIQEWRFNQYCMRLQRMICEKLDQEFKLFLRWRGINIDSNLFELQFNEPQNFASYRQAEVDQARIGSFTQLEAFPYLSKRFLLTRYLGLTEEEIADNERMWAEEQGDVDKAPPGEAGLRSIGISPGGLDADLEAAAPPAEGEAGAAPPAEVGAPAPGAAAAAAPAPTGTL